MNPGPTVPDGFGQKYHQTERRAILNGTFLKLSHAPASRDLLGDKRQLLAEGVTRGAAFSPGWQLRGSWHVRPELETPLEALCERHDHASAADDPAPLTDPHRSRRTDLRGHPPPSATSRSALRGGPRAGRASQGDTSPSGLRRRRDHRESGCEAGTGGRDG